MRSSIINSPFMLSAVALCISTPVQAADSYYFSKPGVSRQLFESDVRECLELAKGVRVAKQSPYSYVQRGPYSAYAVGIASFLLALSAGAERRRLEHANERICMADKGYARMKVDRSVINEVERLKDEQQRIDRLFQLAAATEPVGERTKE